MRVLVVEDDPSIADLVDTYLELAEREGVLLSPYQNRRWDSDLLTLRRQQLALEDKRRLLEGDKEQGVTPALRALKERLSVFEAVLAPTPAAVKRTRSKPPRPRRPAAARPARRRQKK